MRDNQYEKYRALADKIANLYCCGRLADFKYYNMDQALERALFISNMLVEKGKQSDEYRICDK